MSPFRILTKESLEILLYQLSWIGINFYRPRCFQCKNGGKFDITGRLLKSENCSLSLWDTDRDIGGSHESSLTLVFPIYPFCRILFNKVRQNLEKCCFMYSCLSFEKMPKFWIIFRLFCKISVFLLQCYFIIDTFRQNLHKFSHKTRIKV